MRQDQSINDARTSRSWWICLALALFTLALYAPALRNGFIAFDDPGYVTENRHVQAGLTFDSIAWAFRSTVVGNWHPITMLSHMLDCQIYGLRPWGHHLTNILLHAANTVLIFLVLTRLTGQRGRSACVAVLFAAHPVHIESVAWVAERKDVLCAFFWLLAIWSYARYAENLKFQISNLKFSLFGTTVLFALALMSKPMAITLPFVLLLLDFWPLRRLDNNLSRLLTEKWPLLLLSVVWCGITVWAQGVGQAVATSADLSIAERVNHTTIAYLHYVRVMVWPAGLAAYYPYQHHESILRALAAGLVLLLISGVALAGARRRPWLVVGWLWFVGTLVPVIGLVQVGGQAWADRYLYLPSIGFLIMVVWEIAEWAERATWVKLFSPAAVVALAAVTLMDLPYWQNTRSLYERAMNVTTNNFVAMTLVGAEDDKIGKLDAAIALYRQAAACKTNYPEARFYLGRAYDEEGKKDQALLEYEEALRLSPELDAANVMVGLHLAVEKKYDDAISHYQAALKANPESAAAECDWALALIQQRRWRECIPHYERALLLDPTLDDARRNLAVAYYQNGLALEREGNILDAISQYNSALGQKPDLADALQHLAWIFATDARPELRNGPRAVEMATRACVLTDNKRPSMFLTLAAAEAEAGKFPDALAAVDKAEALANSEGMKGLEPEIARMRADFTAGHSLH